MLIPHHNATSDTAGQSQLRHGSPSVPILFRRQTEEERQLGRAERNAIGGAAELWFRLNSRASRSLLKKTGIIHSCAIKNEEVTYKINTVNRPDETKVISQRRGIKWCRSLHGLIKKSEGKFRRKF
ncbi:hypothetical protein KM043_016867 [Ampulex compressa]|nr:hypothetical protein KM043_016867 [Ampulex compressa]